jgi:hypothetical protein
MKPLQLEKRLTIVGPCAIDDAAARGLAGRVAPLSVEGNPVVSPELARKLLADTRSDMSSVCEISAEVAVAKALASRKGPLALPNLKKISPKTLTALVEKQDIDIPRVETLELIAEPDGSATEDFVIPKWLEERQQRLRQP